MNGKVHLPLKGAIHLLIIIHDWEIVIHDRVLSYMILGEGTCRAAATSM